MADHIEMSNSTMMPNTGEWAMKLDGLYLVQEGKLVAKLKEVVGGGAISAPVVQVGSRSSDLYWYLGGML